MGMREWQAGGWRRRELFMLQRERRCRAKESWGRVRKESDRLACEIEEGAGRFGVWGGAVMRVRLLMPGGGRGRGGEGGEGPGWGRCGSHVYMMSCS